MGSPSLSGYGRDALQRIAARRKHMPSPALPANDRDAIMVDRYLLEVSMADLADVLGGAITKAAMLADARRTNG